MATVMEFSSPAAEFPLGSVFETLPGVTVELERFVPHGSHIIPYFWVRGADAGEVEASFENHPGVSDVMLIDSVDDEHLMRARWEQGYVGVLRALAEAEAVLLSGTGTVDGWRFEVRSEGRSEISEFRAYCQEHDISITITAVHALLPIQGEGYTLTDTQREALLLAFERGYFDSPREIGLQDVAEEIGITQQSLSSRLRRGHRRLIESTLVEE